MIRRVPASRAAIECKAALWMRALPKEIESLTLNRLQKIVIGQGR
jgi:hypothetical protein